MAPSINLVKGGVKQGWGNHGTVPFPSLKLRRSDTCLCRAGFLPGPAMAAGSVIRAQSEGSHEGWYSGFGGCFIS